MNKRTPILLVTCGTLGAVIAVMVKKFYLKSQESFNPLRLLAIDTAFDAPEIDLLQDSERLSVSELPVAQMKATPDEFPNFSQINFDHLEDVASLKAGALRPPTTHAALIAKYPELERRILTALQELGACRCDEPPSIWVAGSVSSTTGRGVLLETLFAVNRVVQKQGGYCPIHAILIDSEGLTPSQLEIRRRIEGGFYREFERAVLSSRRRPLPRPHDTDWVTGRPAHMVFRFTGADSQSGNLRSVEELTSSITDWITTSLLDPVTFNLISGPAGDRGRLLPSVQPATDGHLVDPRQRYFNCSGISAISLNTPSVGLYADAARGLSTLRRIEGSKRPAVENLIRELRLDYAVLANAASEANLVASINKNLTGLENEINKAKVSEWRGLTQNALFNLARQIEQAQGLVVRKLEETCERLRKTIDGRLTAFVMHGPQGGAEDSLIALGLNGAAAYLTDVLKQTQEVKSKATSKQANPVDLANVHRRVDEALSNLKPFAAFLNKGVRESLVSQIRQGYTQTLELVVANAVLTAAQSFQEWIEQRLQTVRKAICNIQVAQTALARRKAQALAVHKNGRVLLLAQDENEMEKLIEDAGLVKQDLIEAATNNLLENIMAKSELIVGLANALSEDLATDAIKENAALCPVTHNLKAQFSPQFRAKFNTETECRNAFKWLVEKARPLSGVIDPTLEHKLRVQKVEYQSVLVPTALLAIAVQQLTRLGIPANHIRPVEDLDAIVCVSERLGLPAHAFPYIRMVGNSLPENPELRGPLTLARWACEWLPTIENFDPYRGWSPNDLVNAGALMGVLSIEPESVCFSSNATFLGGTLNEAAAMVGHNGYLLDLKQGIQSALSQLSSAELEVTRKDFLGRRLLPPESINRLYQQLVPLHKWIIA